MEFNEILAQRINMARVMQMLSLDELCDKMNGLVSKQALSNYEKGKNMPNSTILIALADALQVSVDYLFRPFEVEITSVAFRKKSTMRVKKENALKERIRDRIERYLEVEKCLNITFDIKMHLPVAETRFAGSTHSRYYGGFAVKNRENQFPAGDMFQIPVLEFQYQTLQDFDHGHLQVCCHKYNIADKKDNFK